MRKILVATLFVSSVAYSAQEKIYVPDNGLNKLFVIDSEDNTVIASLAAGAAKSIAILPNYEFGYVSAGTNVLVIQTTDNTIVDTIGVGANCDGVVAHPNGNFVYVMTLGSNTVSVIETAGNTVITSITVGNSAFQGAITPDGSSLYVANRGNGNVSVIDTLTNMVIQTITVGSFPWYIAANPAGGEVFVGNYVSGSISVIDTASNTVTNTVSGYPTIQGIGFAPDGSKFALISGNNLFVLNSSSFMTEASFSFLFPLATAYNLDGSNLYVGFSGNVAVIDPLTNTQTATIGSFAQPYWFGFVPGAVPNQLTGTELKNDFGLFYELFNLLEWGASLSEVTGYYVYRDGVRIARLDSSTLTYEDHNRPAGVSALYSVTSIAGDGTESSIGTTTIPN